MDPVLGTTIVGVAASFSGVVIAFLSNRNNLDRVRLEDLVRRLKRRLIDKYGENPDDVDDI